MTTPPRRVLSLWLPRFATDRLCRRCASADRAPPVALATVRPSQGRLIVAAVNHKAETAGVTPGLSLADARAFLPDLETVAADPAGAARDLAMLTDWCGRYTPIAATDGSDGLWLDITGCAHLFDGEQALLADLGTRLKGFGFSTRAAIADTPGASWAIARYGTDTKNRHAIAALDTALTALAPLPIAGLRLAPEPVNGLAGLGLHRIGDLYNLPRAPLVARFGGAPLRRLDQALGRRFEPIEPSRPPLSYRLRLALPEPVGRAEDIAAAARRLLDGLCQRLERQRQGARRIEIALFRVDGTVVRTAVGTGRPVRNPNHLMHLLARPLQEVDPGFGVELVMLAAPVAGPLAASQQSLDRRGETMSEGDIGLLVDRLGNRLGAANVLRQMPRQSHLPERAVIAAPALSEETCPVPVSASNDWPTDRPRPLRLLRHPEPVEAMALTPDHPPTMFRWRQELHRIARADGPERIAPEWWREAVAATTQTRDYYLVEDEIGRRFWLYRLGLYPPAPAGVQRPRWYLHGFFA